MQRFIQQHADQVSGALSGFDRMRFRGTIRLLAQTQGLLSYLNHIGVLLKNFVACYQLTAAARTILASLQAAQNATAEQLARLAA